MVNCVTYSTDIANMILANLDGWVIESTPSPVETETETESDSEVEGVNPFMTTTELQHKANKVITDVECRLFYEEALDMAYVHTNRLNVDDLSETELKIFLRGVCKWAASNLWNKYNIRVNNEDMEDTYVQSYGGLLYKSALKTLNQFINQRVCNLSNNRNTDDVDDIWII